MGRVKLEPQQSKNTINHFSHPQHPLELITHQNFAPSQVCSGCKIQATGSVYTCKSCNFFLHLECSQMPQQITHPFDKEHNFTLLPKPIYPKGISSVMRVGKQVMDSLITAKLVALTFTYSAVFPQRVTHWSHHHQLELPFSSPYPDKSFCCDICKNIGGNQWLYRCHTCGFDAHMKCTKLQSPPHQSHLHQIPTSTISRSAPQQHQPPGLSQHHSAGHGRTNQGINSGTAAAVPQFGASQNNEVSLPEILPKQREDQDKMLQEMIMGATSSIINN